MWGYFIPAGTGILGTLLVFGAILLGISYFWVYILIWGLWLFLAIIILCCCCENLGIGFILEIFLLFVAIVCTSIASEGDYSLDFESPKVSICTVDPKCTYGKEKIPILVNNTSSVESIEKLMYKHKSDREWSHAFTNLDCGKKQTIYLYPGVYEFKVISKSTPAKNKTSKNLFYEVSLCGGSVSVRNLTMLCFGGLNFFPYSEKDIVNGTIIRNQKYGTSTKTKYTPVSRY